MSRATNWDEVPLLLSVNDLREKIGLSRQHSYELAHVLGLRLGKRLVVPKHAMKKWMEGNGAR